MNNRAKRKYALGALGALAAVWTAVWAVHRSAEASIPSAEKVSAWLRSDPLARDEATRVVDRLAADYNRLDFLEKRALRESSGRELDAFVARLDSTQKARLADAIMPPGFQKLLEGFSKMPEADRNKMLQRSRRELVEKLPDSPARAMIEQANAEMLNHIAKRGLAETYGQLPPDLKLQLLPFIEQVQNNMRRLND